MSIEQGQGALVSVTEEAQRIVISAAAARLVVFNLSAADLWAGINLPTAEAFEALVAAEEALSIPAGQNFTFDQPTASIESLCLMAAEAGTLQAAWAAYAESGAVALGSERAVGSVVGSASLLDRMAFELPGCPDALLLTALQTATRRFCFDSGCWVKDLVIDLVLDQDEYALPLPVGVDLLRIRGVSAWWTADAATAAGDRTEVDRDAWVISGTANTPTIKLWVPAPEAVTAGLLVRAALFPQHGQDTADATFVNYYTAAILARAVADLAKLPARRWTSRGLAEAREKDYRRELGMAKGQLARSFAGHERMNA